jgi:hypothetical protein
MRLPAGKARAMVPAMVRKVIGLGFLLACLAGSQCLAKGFDWPKKDSFELKELEKAKEGAAKAKKAITFIVVHLDLDSREKRDEDGAEASIQLTNDAIKALKGFSVIVRVNPHELAGDPSPFSAAVGEGLQAAGGVVPLVVVSDATCATVFGSVGAQEIADKGREKFRDIEKKFKASQKTTGKDKE